MKTVTKSFMATARSQHEATEEARQQADRWLRDVAPVERLHVEGKSYFTGMSHAHLVVVTVVVSDSYTPGDGERVH